MPKPDDPEIVKPFCEAISKGHSVATAATLAGISERAAHEWMQRGNEVLDAHDGETEESLDELGAHALFTLAVKMAEADFVSSKIDVIDKATKGKGGWVPAMTLLERRRPQDFGRFQRIEIESTKTYNINLTDQLPPGAAAALHALAQAEQDRAARFLPPGEREESAQTADVAARGAQQ